MSKFKKGDLVRVKKSVKKPKYGWADVTHSSVGVVKGYQIDGCMKVRFPEYSHWSAKESEMELTTKQAYRKPITRNTLRLYG